VWAGPLELPTAFWIFPATLGRWGCFFRSRFAIQFAQNDSDAIAREQGQERFNASIRSKLCVLDYEDFLHFRDCGVRLMRQQFDGPLLLRENHSARADSMIFHCIRVDPTGRL